MFILTLIVVLMFHETRNESSTSGDYSYGSGFWDGLRDEYESYEYIASGDNLTAITSILKIGPEQIDYECQYEVEQLEFRGYLYFNFIVMYILPLLVSVHDVYLKEN